VFDILSLNGRDTCELPLTDRKQLLKKLLPKNPVVKYLDHVKADGKGLFEEVTKMDMEGIMAKKADSLYYPGRRSAEWLKIKQHKTQEALIAGFTKAQGSRKHFGALILAEKNVSSYNYIGHVGTGFDEKKLKEIIDMLKPLVRKDSPFDEKIPTNMPVTWVEPEVICEVKFSEKTKGGSLRHPVFMHLRPDKPMKDMETETKSKLKPVMKKKASGEDKNEYKFGSITVPVTHTSKVFWPDEGITKGDVIEYYQSISSVILPYLKGRPQSLKRTPNGIADGGFFQKDAGKDAPNWVKTKKIFSESANKEIEYIICNDKPTLCYLNNLGCIELNTWHSVITSLDKPDYLVIDIDPSDKNTFDQVIEAALAIHELFEKAKAPNFCKTSGSTGMHIYVPVHNKYTYDQLKDFSKLICLMVNDVLPDFTTLERNLQKRGNDFIYLDFLQNRRGQTIASPYSIRPKPGATVSTPLEWKEVKKGLDPSQFNIHTMQKRLEKKGDLFSGVIGKGIDLSRCLKLLDI
jgi:bifunctional non-homologous end joining protein LigD